ncbi:MAG: DUF1491 family protein [Rhodospirillales bacterium]|nr:DUF1491 family protein [Rhodospirillales bacterium]
MPEPRLKTEIWVSAALRRGDAVGRPGVMLQRGDRDSGGVLIVLRSSTGLSVLSQVRTAEGAPAWLRATGPEPVDETTADAYLARQMRRDPDLWVIEFASPDLQPPFDADIL